MAELATVAVHGGSGEPVVGAAVTPVFRSTVFRVPPGTPYYEIRYPRLSTTPNHEQVTAKLAALEGGDAALVTASGMAAISTALLGSLRAGDRLLCQDQLYGGTDALVREDLPRYGIGVDYFDASVPGAWEKEYVPGQTRAVYVEAITNPLLRVADHHGVVAFARAQGLTAIIDSTFAPPVNFRPLALGYDLVVHSASKYLNGHSDLIAGAIIGGRSRIDGLRPLLSHLGGFLDAESCFLLDRGLKTLPLRVAKQNQTAQAIAEFLAGHPAIRAVHYPGLAGHRQHARARELFSGFGGVLAFELVGGGAAAERLLPRLQLAFAGPSLGGVETLITRPVDSSHQTVPADERARLGISDSLVRLSVGIEDAGDLIDDLRQGLEGC